MQKTALKFLFSSLFSLVFLLNAISLIQDVLIPKYMNDEISIHHIDSALIKTIETTSEKNQVQRIIPHIISDNYFSYKFITEQFIKSQKITEIIFTTKSAINIRISSFLVSRYTTSA